MLPHLINVTLKRIVQLIERQGGNPMKLLQITAYRNIYIVPHNIVLISHIQKIYITCESIHQEYYLAYGRVFISDFFYLMCAQMQY